MLPYFYIGSEAIFTYPLILGIIWALSFNFSKKLINLKKVTIPHFNIFYFGVFLNAWLGAKFLFLITLEASIVERAISSTNFWLGGGFVFFGGLLFGLTFTIMYSLKYKVPLDQFSFAIPVLTFGHGLGRVACFLAGCCYGTHCDLPWAIDLHGKFRHPVQLYEALSLFILSIILFKRYKRGQSIIIEYIFSYSALRFTLEFFRGDMIRGVSAIGLSTSQIISIGLSLCCGAYLLYKKFIKSPLV